MGNGIKIFRKEPHEVTWSKMVEQDIGRCLNGR
jgi:hypothetical protein